MSLPARISTPGESPTLGTPISDLPQAQVDAIIRTKRKVREPKACYPCHTRKVKCDRNLPCEGCIKRDHADLCSYERPSQKRQLIAQPFAEPKPTSAGLQPTATTPDRLSIPREEWDNVCSRLRDMEQTIASLRASMECVEGARIPSAETQADEGRARSEDIQREGIHAASELGSGTTYLGARSVLAYLSGTSGASQETAQALLEGGILPKLGLDNESATYPFVDLWSSDTSALDISTVCAALPDDSQCRRLWRFYREIAGTIYPVLPDVDSFEQKMEFLLRNRASSGGVSKRTAEDLERPFGMTVAFIGLLFAILAAGTQSSDLPGKDRELTSQVYVCCSYQCLRTTSFMSRPNLEAIQTLLIIGNVLSYNMNPGVSYILLGMTLRMALALGLQVESQRFSPDERFLRRRVWWSMAWQDSHFSLSYDRPSTMAFSHPDIPYHTSSRPRNRSFFETLARIIQLTLEIVRSRMISPHTQMSFKAIQAYKEQLRHILDDAGPYLHDPSACQSTKDNIERLGLKLHSSYIESELCRPALRSEFDPRDHVAAALRADCIASLRRTVEAYVDLHAVSSLASRSWIGLQRSISAAFLLAVIPESKSDPQVWGLLRRLENVIADRAAADGAFEQGAAPANNASSAPIRSPELYGSTVKLQMPGGDVSRVTNGVTNIPVSALDPNYGPSASSVPAMVPPDIETQWAKPLLKSLRALQKLNAAFVAHSIQQQTMTPSLGPNLGGNFPPPSPSPGSVNIKRNDSLPPVTPESSGSSEWTFPNILDRAAEYIHPPLWA